MLSIVFIPIFSRYLAEENEAGGWEAFSVANFLTAFLIILTAVMWWFTPSITPYIQSGWSAEKLSANELSHHSSCQIFHLTGGLISATLQAQDQHTMPRSRRWSTRPASCWRGSPVQPLAKGFAWGVLIGSFLGPFGVPLLGALKQTTLETVFQSNPPDFRTYFSESASRTWLFGHCPR